MNYDEDVSDKSKSWLSFLGNYAPTTNITRGEVKGWCVGNDGDFEKVYLNSAELREISCAMIEVADWLDNRAKGGLNEK